jgi:hypothetical protein
VRETLVVREQYNETLANKFYIFVMSCLKVICWALIFIFKLRFPPGVSIAAVINMRQSNFCLHLRRIENLNLGREINYGCLKNNNYLSNQSMIANILSNK